MVEVKIIQFMDTKFRTKIFMNEMKCKEVKFRQILCFLQKKQNQICRLTARTSFRK